MRIEINLSIEKCQSDKNLSLIIDILNKKLHKKYPIAEIQVRKGYFKTIDGVWSDDGRVELELYDLLNDVRDKVLLGL